MNGTHLLIYILHKATPTKCPKQTNKKINKNWFHLIVQRENFEINQTQVLKIRNSPARRPIYLLK
jgi:hypothetical protein